jgi:osmotically-inducible protein OsmY
VAKSAALLILPSPTQSSKEANADQTAAPLLAQSLEDLHLAERVERALHATGQGALRGVDVTAHARNVVLSGRVPTYYLKQIAQATALAVPGVHQVRNDLEVGRPS